MKSLILRFLLVISVVTLKHGIVEGDTNAVGVLLDNLFSDLNLTQIITEPTHLRDDCKPFVSS